MSKINDGGPAFPTDSASPIGCGLWHHEGMSLRDYFAAKALPAIIALPLEQMRDIYGTSSVSEAAYLQADTMLEVRSAK